jgi:hypothetical protein
MNLRPLSFSLTAAALATLFAGVAGSAVAQTPADVPILKPERPTEPLAGGADAGALMTTGAPRPSSVQRPAASALQRAIDETMGKDQRTGPGKTVQAILDPETLTFYTDDGRAIPFALWVRLQQLDPKARQAALRQMFPNHQNDEIMVFGRDPNKPLMGDQFGSRFKGMTFEEVGKVLGFDAEALRPGMPRAQGIYSQANDNRFGAGTGSDLPKPDFSGGVRWRDRILQGQGDKK